MQKHHWLALLAIAGAVAGCATVDTRYEQCASSSFTGCLAATAQQCDDMFAKAHAECGQKLNANSMFENMPELMREGYLNRCLVNSVVTQSGQPDAETKDCLRW